MTNEQTIDKLRKEQFCLQFELNAIANLVIRREAERWVPGFIWPTIEQEHRSRYVLAAKYSEGKAVLDIACGSGYGSFILATEGKARTVYGYDLDDQSILYGNHRFHHEHVIREVANAEQFNSTGMFDVAVSFETIEHLNDYNSFLNNINNSLKAKGVFIVSTPIVQKTTADCGNPYHRTEWSFYDFHELIKKMFVIEEVYVQSIELEEKKKSLRERLWLKIKNALDLYTAPINPIDPLPQRYVNQYSPSKIVAGYQTLICRKIH